MSYQHKDNISSMPEYRGYHAMIRYDDDDNIFVGEIFGINDSINFHATSVDELREMFHQSVDNYLSVCEATGKKPDKEFKGSFNVRITPELHRKASLAAARENVSLNQYVMQAISNSLD